MEAVTTVQNLKLFHTLTSLPLKSKKVGGFPNSDFYITSTSYSTRNTEVGRGGNRHGSPSSLKTVVSPIKMLSGFHNRAESCSQGEALHRFTS